jgi:hypothetical protein
MIFLALLVAALTCLRCESRDIELKCRNYNYCCYIHVHQIYQCELVNKDDFVNISPDDTISNMTVVKMYGEPRDEFGTVEGFVAKRGRMSFMPKNLDRFLRNLTTIRITEMAVQEVHQSDLRPFTELIHLCLSDNQIKVIEPDLFRFNSKLEAVNLSYNPIAHISPRVFDGLRQINYLNLVRIECKMKITDAVNITAMRYDAILRNIRNGECFDDNVEDRRRYVVQPFFVAVSSGENEIYDGEK